MVVLKESRKESWQKRCTNEVLPTPESPMKTTLKTRSGVALAGTLRMEMTEGFVGEDESGVVSSG